MKADVVVVKVEPGDTVEAGQVILSIITHLPAGGGGPLGDEDGDGGAGAGGRQGEGHARGGRRQGGRRGPPGGARVGGEAGGAGGSG